jgi:hypothetical protein
MFDIDFNAPSPLQSPRHSLTSHKGSRSATPTFDLHASIKYSSALQPLPDPELNPLPTTPSTFPSVYLFFLIVVACHKPKTELSSPDHAIQHTRAGTHFHHPLSLSSQQRGIIPSPTWRRRLSLFLNHRLTINNPVFPWTSELGLGDLGGACQGRTQSERNSL